MNFSTIQIFGIALAFVASVSDAQAIAPPASISTAPAPAPFRLLRYEEDYRTFASGGGSGAPDVFWRTLKHVPLDGDPRGAFASFGGEVRLQYLARWDDQFGRVPGAQ